MEGDRPHKIPRARTIAKHYSQGKFCDYPADIVFGAVNAYNYDYNPTAIPVKLGFATSFKANIEAFIYLSEHNTESEVSQFLSDPNGYMSSRGVRLPIPLEHPVPQIMAAMVEDDMLAALRSDEYFAVLKLMRSKNKESWPYRHPERFDKAYMERHSLYSLEGIETFLDNDYLASKGFSKDFGLNLLKMVAFFS